MNYIITNDQHYKDIATAIRNKLKVDTEYYPEEMARAINTIPSSADGTNTMSYGAFFYDPNEYNYPQKFKGIKLRNLCETLFLDTENLKYLDEIYYSDDCTAVSTSKIGSLPNLTKIYFPDGLTAASAWGVLQYLPKLSYVRFPKSLTNISSSFFAATPELEFVILEDGFNAPSLNLNVSTKYSHETIVSWLNALADRTDFPSYRLNIGSTNLAKLTADEIKIATDKNWTLG